MLKSLITLRNFENKSVEAQAMSPIANELSAARNFEIKSSAI
jgi:hypothetical protein